MNTHELKCLPEWFQQIKLGYKRFEMRMNDRDFKNGDTLLLREYVPQHGERDGYTGNELSVQVTSIMHGPQFGLKEGWCCMSIMIL